MTRLARSIACALLVLGTMAAAPSAPTPTPTASPTPDPAVVARAKNCFTQLQAGKIDRTQLTPDMSTALTADQLTKTHAAIGNLGAPVTFEQEQTGTQSGDLYYVYLVTFGSGQKLEFVFAVDPQGKIAGLRLTPAQ